MIDEFITIKEIIQRTGKSDSTVRRALKKRPKPEREQYTRLEVGKLVISWQWVKKCLGIDHTPIISGSHNDQSDAQPSDIVNDYINSMKEQLFQQQTEIERLHGIISGLIHANGQIQKHLERLEPKLIPEQEKEKKKKGKKKSKKKKKK